LGRISAMQQALHRSSLVPRGFVVESACYEGDKAVITVRSSGSVGLCPSCGTVSRRIHSRYRRRVTDLPLSGRVVELLVIARRFRCDAVLCGRQIFTERFADGILYHLHNGVNRVYLEGSWLDGLYPSLEV